MQTTIKTVLVYDNSKLYTNRTELELKKISASLIHDLTIQKQKVLKYLPLAFESYSHLFKEIYSKTYQAILDNCYLKEAEIFIYSCNTESMQAIMKTLNEQKHNFKYNHLQVTPINEEFVFVLNYEVVTECPWF